MSDITLDSPPPRRRSLPPPTDPTAPATAGMLHAHAEEDAEDSDAILAGVQRIAKGQRQIEKHLEAGATAQMRQAEIAQARLDAEREMREAAKAAEAAARAAEAERQRLADERSAAWWARMAAFAERAANHRLVQLVVFVVLLSAFPWAREYAAAWIGGSPVTVAAPAPAQVAAPAESEP